MHACKYVEKHVCRYVCLFVCVHVSMHVHVRSWCVYLQLHMYAGVYINPDAHVGLLFALLARLLP